MLFVRLSIDLMRITKRKRIILRSAAITSYILMCLMLAVVFMGRVFNVVETNGFNSGLIAFSVINDREFMIFGKIVDFPIIEIGKKIYSVVYNYAPGIIKLLGFAVNGAEELIGNSIYSIVSSLR